MSIFNPIKNSSFLTAALGVLASVSAPYVLYAAECTGGLCNPLDSKFSTIPLFIAGALQVLVIVALPIITLFLVVAGFMFIAARGNSGKLDEAKKNFVYVIIGALLILGAWIIATLIGSTVTQLIGK